MSGIPHLYGVVIHGYEEKRIVESKERTKLRRPLVGVQQKTLRSSACSIWADRTISQPSKSKPGWLLYDSKDLVTHAVCVGMTGSGKTGLCIGLLEEAAIDGIPALIIDPKGDLANLMLNFPQLRGEDFAPWVNEDDARKKGLSPADYATQQAEMWKKGLEDWGQSGERIQKLRDAADVVVYTPGSNAGIPVSILKSFAAPSQEILDDPEMLRERISTTVTSLLGFVGVEADPIKSREHILLSTILDRTWKAGQDLDLATLIQQIQTPPVAKIGVLDLDSFYPSKERFALAMQLNNLLASPGFSAWLEGEALDVGQMLHSPGRQTAARHFLDRAPQRCRADVLCHVAVKPNARLGTGTVRHDQPPCHPLYGRNLRLFPAGRQSAVEAAVTDVAKAGSRIRFGRGVGDTEPR